MDSKLQIISGQFRGRKLFLPSGARPTQNRARIALFNMLESGLISTNTPLTIWDAFGGSGAFGIECISRYHNATIIFTDISPESIKTIQKNLKLIAPLSRITQVIQSDAINSICKYGSTSDIIFIDPPYNEHELGNSFVKKLSGVARPGTILIWEQEVAHKYSPDSNAWEILRDKQYGRARFLILKKRAN